MTAGSGSPFAGALVVGVFGVAVAIAAFLSPFASLLPDGLDHAAERLGFSVRAASAWRAPLRGYTVPFVSSPGIAVAAAGVVGTICVAVVAWGVSRGVRQGHHDVHR
jgi:cobalt/nickel transport protein